MNFFNDVIYIIVNYWQDFLLGVAWTLIISLVSTLIGLLFGLIIGIIRTIPYSLNKAVLVIQKIVNGLLSAYIEVFRGTPMMVQAVVIYWGYAFMMNGVTLPLIPSAIVIVSINTGAYIAEIVRGGINGIEKGQFEACRALGMNHFQTMVHVVIPQVMKTILPAVSNEFVINIKDTSVLNVIGVTELYFVMSVTVKMTYKNFPVYLVGCVIYFILTFIVTRIIKFIEKKIAGKKHYSLYGSNAIGELIEEAS